MIFVDLKNIIFLTETYICLGIIISLKLGKDLSLGNYEKEINGHAPLLSY